MHTLKKYLSEFVYGGIDGSVTTFAVVAGATGAHLDAAIVIILGFANLLADGFSMSVGSYLSAKTEKENYEKHRKTEYWEIENIPEEETEEIRMIYRSKGFEGDLLEKVVQVITADKDRWVSVMMKDELEMIPDSKTPVKIAGITYISFILIGLIPLLSYVIQFVNASLIQDAFLLSCFLTMIAFVIIGWLKSYINHTNQVKSILETVGLGAAAAFVAYFVGGFLESLLLSN